jgi:hypothetical protein
MKAIVAKGVVEVSCLSRGETERLMKELRGIGKLEDLLDSGLTLEDVLERQRAIVRRVCEMRSLMEELA